MNPERLPDEFWDWLANGSPANNAVLGECYKQYLLETDNRELIPVGPELEGMLLIPFKHQMQHVPSPEEVTAALGQELVDRVNKRFDQIKKDFKEEK